MIQPMDIRGQERVQGWQALYEEPVTFQLAHFAQALDNIVRNPGINSTILLRADIYLEFTLEGGFKTQKLEPVDDTWKTVNIDDIIPRVPTMEGWIADHYVVRRNIPRNPHRDVIANQTCIFYTDPAKICCFLVYFPHCEIKDMPFYLPDARGVGILYDGARSTVSVHYLCDKPLVNLSLSDRIVRIGLHLLNTACKHSRGLQTGYQKRVNHDLVIDRRVFQNTYIRLKQRYATDLVENWAEKTDPSKHVFEDLGIAAFLIELWRDMYKSPEDFEFKDLGCGNGLLVHILVSEGFHGEGIDIRRRKSWDIYPQKTQDCLKAGILMPNVLSYTSENANLVHIGQNPPNADSKLFFIGNHSDELTVWLPLLGHPFMVIPCCSHSLSGQKTRFRVPGNKSAYQALIEKTLETARDAGWDPEVEYLRIPSTRNGAIVGRKLAKTDVDIRALISQADGDQWIACAERLQGRTSSH